MKGDKKSVARLWIGGINTVVHLSCRIAVQLLGGVRIILGSKMIDASLKSRLEKMRRSLKGTGV